MTMTLEVPSRGRNSWRRSLQAVAEIQDDLVTVAQLRGAGVPSSTVSDRVRPGGGWTRVLPGVYLVSGGRPDRRQRERAGLLYAGADALLGGATVLRRVGVRAGRLQETSDDPRAPEAVHVLVPHGHHLSPVGFLDVARTRRWPEEQVIDGMRACSTARAVADVARRSQSDREVGTLVDECLRRGLATLAELRAELSDGPRQGSAVLRSVLQDRLDPWERGPDPLVAALVEAAGLPVPVWSPTLVDPQGQPVGRPLAWIASLGVALEPPPSDPGSVARQQRLAMHGVTVFPVSASLLRADPAGQARALAQACRHALLRPTPAVRAVSQQSGARPR